MIVRSDTVWRMFDVINEQMLHGGKFLQAKMKKLILLASGLIFLTSAQAQTDYVKAIEKWRSDEEANLKKETGWLTVAGLFWLKEGINTVGAGPDFDVRLTDNFKKGKFGEIEFRTGSRP